ncbi:unnamed protein product [Mytilus edulis]|uniref:Uncharacterized protein n=1 Tax=Mytilus edulis TaxID=6550 RepID=A0A8S3VKT6_MYTED|nr:unnamed protein product [Mytilus edulis]
MEKQIGRMQCVLCVDIKADLSAADNVDFIDKISALHIPTTVTISGCLKVENGTEAGCSKDLNMINENREILVNFLNDKIGSLNMQTSNFTEGKICILRLPYGDGGNEEVQNEIGANYLLDMARIRPSRFKIDFDIVNPICLLCCIIEIQFSKKGIWY